MQATQIPVEHRFPLSLKQSISSIRELYETSKRSRWVPEKDIDWSATDFSGLNAEVRGAARLAWSRRAWVEYASLSETPALLVRLCLEVGRESDPKYFLTVRNTEEGWLIECYHRYAQTLGGYVDRPSSAAQEAVFNQNRQRQVLDSRCLVDAFIVVHSVLEDSLELALCEAYLSGATESVAAHILQEAVQSKTRHAAFGWLYARERSMVWSDDDRRQIDRALRVYLQEVELQGYHCAWLADPGCAESLALDQAANSGLGVVSSREEQAVFKASLSRTRDRLAELGLSLDLSGVMARTGI